MSGDATILRGPVVAVPTDSPRVRLEFLDGIRGLAALYVVYYHAAWMYPQSGELAHRLGRFLKLLAFGHYAVAIFIVLSGYCLMLPVIRTSDRRLRGGVGEYLRRRARRILPPYYACVALSVLAVSLRQSMRSGPSSGLSTGAVVSHLLLLQNLDDFWVNSINLPLWSVATEWQIYFVFPALLVVWRRTGIGAALAIGFALGYAATFLGWFPAGCPWMLALFSIGMAGATLSFPTDPAHGLRLRRVPWGSLALVLLIATGALYTARPKVASIPPESLIDPLVGIITACFLIRSAHRIVDGHGPRSPVLRILESKVVAGLGNFSFSLYLIHLVVLNLIYFRMLDAGYSLGRTWSVVFLAGPPTCLVLAYLFHLTFERRFMTSRPRPRSNMIVLR